MSKDIQSPVPATLLMSIMPYLLACVVFSALPLFANAQDVPPASPHHECGDFNIPPMQKDTPPPQPLGLMMLPPPLAHLDLTDEQQDKIFELTHALARTIYENEKIARKTMQEIQQLTQTDHFDAAKVKSLAESHGKALAELAYLRTAIQAQIWAVLSETQRQQLSKQQEHLHR
jgi:Spy/CpxP family protein refolding chaperone